MGLSFAGWCTAWNLQRSSSPRTLCVRGKADWPPDASVRPRGGVFALAKTAVSDINKRPLNGATRHLSHVLAAIGGDS